MRKTRNTRKHAKRHRCRRLIRGVRAGEHVSPRTTHPAPKSDPWWGRAGPTDHLACCSWIMSRPPAAPTPTDQLAGAGDGRRRCSPASHSSASRTERVVPPAPVTPASGRPAFRTGDQRRTPHATGRRFTMQDTGGMINNSDPFSLVFSFPQ